MTKMRDFNVSNGLSYEETATHNTEPSMVREEFKDECDINVLMAKFEKALHGGPNGLGVMPDDPRLYVDLTMLPETLMEYHDFMQTAETQFMMLNANIRREFDNNPYRFVEFATDPANLEQMQEWGLGAPKAPEAKPMKVEVINPAKAEPAPQAPPAAPGGQSTHGST